VKMNSIIFIVVCALIVIITLAGINLKQNYQQKNEIRDLKRSDAIEPLEKEILDSGLAWGKTVASQDSQDVNGLDQDQFPDDFGKPYKVYYLDIDELLANKDIQFKEYFLEYPFINKSNEVASTCTFGQYNGRWEPCLIGSGLSSDLVEMVSDPEKTADFLAQQDITELNEIKHVRFTTPWGFDAFYLRADENKKYLMPLNAPPEQNLESQKLYSLDEAIKIISNDYEELKKKDGSQTLLEGS